MADELGTAKLVITVDDGPAREKLAQLRQEIVKTESSVGRTRQFTSPATRGIIGPAPPPITNRNEVRQFNLRGTIAALESIAEDISRISAARQGARQINIGTNWGLALEALSEIDSDLRKIAAGKQININTSWGRALQELLDIDTGLKGIAASKQLNIKSSWSSALQELSDIDTDLRAVAAGKQLNLRSAWSQALEQLAQVQTDLQSIAAGKQLNLRSSWSAFLNDLSETKTDIESSAAAKRINIRLSWTKFLAQLDEIAQDLSRLRRSPASQAAVNASLERRAQTNALQTAGGGGGGLTGFLRDVRLREESERKIAAIRKAGYKDAQFAENTLRALVDKRAKAEATSTRQRRRGQGGSDVSGLLSSAIIGGAFPLLFGQGGGASAGGLLGGLAGGAFGQGGGFAGSLLGTVIGQTADQFGALAKALDAPSKNLETFIQNSNLSSRSIEELAQVLRDLGRTAEADALIRADLSRTIDPIGAAKVAAANDSFARSLGDVQERLGYLLAGPAAQFIGWIDEIIQRTVNLPSGTPTAKGALALRGQGAALGSLGVLLGATGLAAAPFTGGATLPLALAGAGLAGLGATQIGGAEFQEQQIAQAGQLQQVQNAILAIEEKRARIQRDIASAIAAGNTSGAASLNIQLQLSDVDIKRQQAKQRFLAREASTESFNLYKSELDALKALEQAYKETEAQRQVALRATAALQQTQNQLALDSIKAQIAAARQLAGISGDQARGAFTQAQDVQASIAAARRREQELGAQITAARQVGNESEAARLVGEQKVAAEQTKLAIIQGADALAQAGKQLAKDAENAFLNLQKLRTGPQGLNKYLSPQDQQNAERLTFEALLPRFRVAQEEFKRLRGVNYAPEFSGPISGVNQAIIDFIQAVKAERDALGTVNDVQKALNTNTAALAKVVAENSTVLKELASKNWAVSVNVAADGSSQAYGDVLNGAVSA